MYGNKNRTNLSSEETEKHVLVLSRCPCWPIPESPLSYFLLTNFSHPEYDWNIACWTLSNQSINQSINSYTLLHPALLMCRHCFTSGFIQVACSRVQPRKVTIEKKDKINEYKKREKTKRRAYQCPPPFITNCLSVYDIVFPMFWTFLWWVNGSVSGPILHML
jgi:hypothetical protein